MFVGGQSVPALTTDQPFEIAAAFFRRGDANHDGLVNIADPIWLLTYLFSGGEAPPCLDAADADDSGTLTLADPIAILQYINGFGPVLPAPGPLLCGIDPTQDGLPICEIACP